MDAGKGIGSSSTRVLALVQEKVKKKNNGPGNVRHFSWRQRCTYWGLRETAAKLDNLEYLDSLDTLECFKDFKLE